MRRTIPTIAILFIGVFGPGVGAAIAEDSPPGSSGDSVAASAWELRAHGRYGDAEALLEKALAGDGRTPELCAARADLFLELGRYEEAAAAAREGGTDPRCRTMLAESLFVRGRSAEAKKIVEKVIEEAPERERPRFLLGRILRETADRDGARRAFEWFFDHYATNDITDPEALTLVAAATLEYAKLSPDVEMDFNPTAKLLNGIRGVKGRDAIDEDYLPAYVVAGDLYMTIYNDPDAKKVLNEALRKNPRYPPALVGLAEQLAFRWQELAGVEKCEEALLTNPNYYPAREFIARVRIGDYRYDEAREQLEQVLAVNPTRKRARGLLAVIDFLTGDTKGFERRVKEILAGDPHYAVVYVDLARTLEEQRRFEEAVTWAKKATETDPDDFHGWWIVGRNLVNLGHEEEAKEPLAKSRAVDPGAHYYPGNVFRFNLREILDGLEEFVESRTPNFIYKIHVGENAVLTKYYHDFMERSWDMLTKKYGFTPEGPILTEVFHLHPDFAARTIGLPGIGALGACFGKVITLDSPSARSPGEFTWASTAHHEFAHVITLQLSKGRVPRWFTEGLSVYEERKYTDWWERDMDRVLYDRWANGELYEISKFNQAFRGGDVMFAYYLGGMMCEFIEDEFGFPKIVAMLKAYGDDEQTKQVLEDVLGVSEEEYDRRFREWVGDYVGKFELVPHWSHGTDRKAKDRLAEAPDDLAALTTAAWAAFQRGNTVDAMANLGRALRQAPEDPQLLLLRGRLAYASGRFDKAKEWYGKYLASGEDDYDTRMQMAKMVESDGDFEPAKEHLAAAKTCFPPSPAPFLQMARLRKGEGDLDGWAAETEEAVRRMNTNIPLRLELADYYESQGEWKKLAEMLTQVVWIYPLDPKQELSVPVHVRLGDAHRRNGDYEKAATEYEVALELGVPEEDRADVRVALGETYLLLGRTRDARREAKAALEADPESKAAKDLLERSR